jgi:hypothetical protein
VSLEKWEDQAACLSAIFGESENFELNQGSNYHINAYPRRVELRNIENGQRPYGYGSVFEVPDRWCPGRYDKYECPLDAIDNQPVAVSKRGIITGFSKKSAVNMKKHIEDNLDDLRIFWTGTYPDEVFEDMTFEEKVDFTRRHFDLFKRRAKYHGWVGFWRKEFAKRKSGGLTGQVISHYHGILAKSGLSEINYVGMTQELCRMWVDTMRLEDLSIYRKALKVALKYAGKGSKKNSFEWLDNKNMISRYISKYMSKSDKDLIPEGVSIGRSWGRIGEVTQAPPVTIPLTKMQMIRFLRICRGLYRSTAKRIRKKYLSDYRKGSFVFMSSENIIRCLKFLRDQAFASPLEQTFADVPF